MNFYTKTVNKTRKRFKLFIYNNNGAVGRDIWIVKSSIPALNLFNKICELVRNRYKFNVLLILKKNEGNTTNNISEFQKYKTPYRLLRNNLCGSKCGISLLCVPKRHILNNSYKALY